MKKTEKSCIPKSFSQIIAFTAEESKSFGAYPALLDYYIKIGRMKRLARGIYQSTSYRANPANLQWEDLIQAVHMVPGGVICLISALALYDLTDEIPRQYWIAIKHGTTIKRGRKFSVMRFRDIDLGRTTIELNGIKVPIFDRERTVVDAFRLLSIETAIKALKMALMKRGNERLDLRKLQMYARKLRVNIKPYLITAIT